MPARNDTRTTGYARARASNTRTNLAALFNAAEFPRFLGVVAIRELNILLTAAAIPPCSAPCNKERGYSDD